jgi:hypothetical protein
MSDLALHPDAAAVRLDDPLGNRQSEACSLAGRVRAAPEAIEDVWEIRVRDAASEVTGCGLLSMENRPASMLDTSSKS